METYKVRITKQAKQHLILIRDYIATELQEPSIAKELVANKIRQIKYNNCIY